MSLRAFSDEDLARDMAKAVADNDAAKIQQCKSLGADPDTHDSVGLTLLQNAVNEGRSSAASALIRAGADVNMTGGPSGWTALHYAAYRGNLFMAELLLQGGAKADLPAFDGDTPLHTAAHAGSLDVVMALVASGANASTRDARGHSPAEIAELRAAERFQFAQKPFTGIADYLNDQTRQAELIAQAERLQREEVARDLLKLKALRPERFRLKPR